MRVTLREIAHKAGVHYSTASHILNGARGSTQVSDTTRRRVLEVAERLGYSANRAAQQLRTRRSHVIGLLTGGLENPFFARMVSLCSEALEAHGYDVILATRRRDEASDLHLLEALMSRQLDGILLWCESDTEVRSWLSRPTGATVVAMGMEIPECDNVMADLENEVERALETLIALGYRRIGYFAPDIALVRNGDPRPGVYRRVLEKHGLPRCYIRYEGSVYDVGAARERAEAFGEEWKEQPVAERPELLFCLNDMTALGVLMGLRRKGLSVPEDIALMGCDDLPLSAQLDVPLTTIAYPLAEVCKEAVGLLLDRLQLSAATEKTNNEMPRRRMVPAQLILRDTTPPKQSGIADKRK